MKRTCRRKKILTGGNYNGKDKSGKDINSGGTRAPCGTGGGGTYIGTGGRSAEGFTILVAFRLLRTKNDSPTKVITELFHVILKAEPRAKAPPQV